MIKHIKILTLYTVLFLFFFELGILTSKNLYSVATNSITSNANSSLKLEKFNEWMQSTVKIMVYMNDGQHMITGAGWILSDDGTIVTNNHVVEQIILGGAKDLYVQFYDGTSAKAEVIGGDAAGDVAIIKVSVKKHLRAMTLGSSTSIKLGEDVYVLGNPLNEGLTITHGIVADKNFVMTEFPFHYIKTDATVNPGNSGGALLDADGNLIGMPSLLGTGANGGNAYGFAITVDDIKWSIKMINKHVPLMRSTLGIKAKQSNAEDKDTGLFTTNGLIVTETVNPLIFKDDVIVGFNDHEIKTFDDLLMELGKTIVGDNYTVTILRQNKTIVINLVGQPLTFPNQIVIVPIKKK